MRIFRLLFIGAALLLSVYGRVAEAANCKAAGTLSVSLAPCPVALKLRFGTAGAIGVDATIVGKLPTQIFVAASAPSGVFTSTGFNASFISPTMLAIGIATSKSLASGHHTGSIDLKFCADSRCAKVLVEVQLPYVIDVFVPPVISQLSPASAKVRAPAFTLKVLGGGFVSGSKIHLGGSALTTKFISSSELTAKVDLAAVTTAQTYSVTVAPPAGFSSNRATFTLEDPKPTLTRISPGSARVGTARFTLTARGTGFVPGSTIDVDGKAYTTSFVSSTELRTNLRLGSKSSAVYSVTVVSPKPGGGMSGKLDFNLKGAEPVILSISPSSKTPTILGFTLSVTGSGFQPDSVVHYFDTTDHALSTAFVSSTSLQAAMPNNSIRFAGDLTVSVVNPAPGGGTSNGAKLGVGAPVPFISWLEPVQAYAGSGDVTLNVRAGNITADTQLEWNGTPLAVIYRGANLLRATVPAADLASPMSATVSVDTPSPGGGTASTTFPIVMHPPVIDTLSPGSCVPGGSPFTLTLMGAYFDPAATVKWNGIPVTTSYVSGVELQAQIPASDVASSGVAEVTVVNPAETGGASLPASFAIDTSKSAVRILHLPVNDVAWDPTRSVFYASVPISSSTDPESIADIDPVSAQIISFVQTMGEPGLLELSGDGTTLYESIATQVNIFTVPFFGGLGGLGTPDATAIRVSSASAHTYAIAYTNGTPTWVLFRENISSATAAAEPWDAMAWSPDGSMLYAGDSEQAGGDFISIAVDPYSGTVTQTATPGLWAGGSRMHVDAASGLVYADGSTAVIDPVSKTIVGNFPEAGVMAPDSSLGCAYFITQEPAQVGTSDYTLSCYSTTDQSLTRARVIPSVNGTPTKMMRWGNEGLVFMTDAGYIYFVSGQIVTGN